MFILSSLGLTWDTQTNVNFYYPIYVLKVIYLFYV